MASQRKPHVFRVTGLSRGLPDGDLQTALQEALNDNFTAGERSQIKTEITIVPSCYESDTQRVALVRFRSGLPRFLTELTTNPLGDWQIEMGDEDINFDSHFFGFTQLYAPDEKKPVIADIIAIAGLDGHAYGSWQGRGYLGRMWLRDFLSKDLPQCRTMIYGYNSKLSSHGVDTILDYGRGLMEEIKKIRNTKELQQRPLFFIAHSFGGIILAHCLVGAITTREEDHPAITSLHRATHGMLLFAIPHKELAMDDIQQMLAGDKPHLREQLLQQISRTLDILVYLLADFKNLIRDRNVVSFYEAEQTRQLVFDSGSSQWERTGKVITAVNTNSALLQLPDYVKDRVPLHADHSMIVKFDTRNAVGYQIALSKLRQFIQDTPQIWGARFSASSLQPCSTVPFVRDRMFVGREAVISAIKEIHGAIGQHHERAALVGLAGVGKTQTAIEYTYRVRESTPDTWVFWIHASNAAFLEQGFQHIAEVAEIPARDDPKINIAQLVHQWLCDPRNGRWLMVLDNADDDSIFFSSNTSNERGPMVSFLPQAAHGSILITSRNGIAARNLVGSEGPVIAVQPMNEEESLALLRARIPGPQSGEDEKALVQALEYIPLAITQAGSYIANRSPRVTVSRYLQLLHESESNQTYLLQHEEAKDLRRDPSIRDAIITTWQLSFEQIRHDQPAAMDLLALMSMFDRQGIPESLVRANGDWLQFEDAVGPLIGYSLVRVEIETASFDMHRLVQLSVRRWLEIHLELARWQKKSRAIMAQTFPNGQYENWTECQTLLPHAKEVMKPISDDQEDRLHVATISFHCGWYLRLRGAYGEAEAMHRRALEEQEKVLGREHPDTLASVDNLSLVLSSQGKYEEAEAMHQQVLEAREKVLGYEHPDTLTSVSNLGLVLSRQGKYKGAEAMHQRALEAREKVLGYEHPDTLTSIDNLGLVLSSQGKYEEAEAMHRRALEAREKVLGLEHPDTLASVNNLSLVLARKGKYKEAEAMNRRALEARENVLGPEHPDTLASVNNLGLVLSSQGKYREAEAMHRRALEAREKVLGCEHPSTLASVNNLSFVLSSQGKYEEAEASSPSELPAFQRAATITTTSQYVSDRIFSAEQMSSLETQTSLPSELEDVQTVYSGSFTMKGSLKEIYIDELVRELVKSTSSFQTTPLAVRRVAEVMPDCLKAFSLRLGSGKFSQQDHLDVTAFIRKYRQDISDAFTKAALDDSSVNAAAGDSSPNETIYNSTTWEARARASMPLHDIMTHWLRYEVQDMNDNAWSPGDFNLHPIEDKDKDKDIETNSGADTDEAVGPVMPELKKYRECIFGDPAYEWLLRDLQKHCDLVPSSPDLSSEIRKAILQALPSQTTFTRQEPSNLYKMTYNMDWNLVSFLNEQEYSKENYQALPLVITVTGSREAAQALTCSQYLHQTWPSSAAGILGLLQTLLIPEEKNKATGDLPDGTKLAAWLYFSERLRVYRIAVEVIGSTYSVIEVGELLSWMGSALQLSPYPDQIAYCRPRVSQFQTIRRSHGKEESQYAAEGSAEIEFTIDRKKQSLGISGECWHGLFRHCVVVEGYPVSRRLEEGAINGLEIPLGMMASLAQAKYVNNFLGVPILKGFSAMLVPTDVHDEFVSWHLVYNKNGDRISYLDSGVTPAQGLMAGRLSQTRHILGWCSDAKYLAGTKDAKHKVGRSRLPKPRENGIFGQTFISSGQMIIGGAPFLVGYKDTPFHVSRAGYIRKLKWIIQKSVVLWDEETKRGWLLNAARALLHLVRASIMHDSTGPLSSECLFQWDKLEEAPADTAHAPESAIKVLLNHNNRALKIYEGKNDLVKFEDRVEHFLNMLEQIFDYEVYAVGPDGDGYNSKSIPRAHFEGWDFHDLATESDPLYPRLANMAPKGKAWIDFTRSIHAINLLGSDFGEILEPLNSSCPHWASLPKNQYYLAAGIADLQMIVEYTGDLTANPIRLNENLVWHNPERIFNFCGCVDASASHTDIVQVILPATLSDSAECNSSIDLQHNGAVVFGYCRDFQWRWGDSGDPKKDDIRADDAHLSAKYDLGQEHSTTSSVGSKSDYAPLSSSDGPSVEDTIQTSVENESTKPKSLSRSYTRWNLETLRAEDYAVGIVCALPLELLAVRALFDQTHPNVQFSAADTNHYALGRWGRHRVVAACLPDGEYGTNSAADVASNLRRSFPSVKFCLMVGIGGGVPSSRNDIRLGDVVVSKPIGINPGVIQYDMGKALKNGVFEQNGVLHAPPRLIMTALSNLKSDPYLSENPLQEYVDEIGACRKEYRYPGSHRDRLFSSRYLHNSKHVTCDRCSDAHVIVRPVRSNPYPRIHYGLVASGNTVIKDAVLRDKWSAEKNVLCFEMEAAGVMNILPCLVIRGICDYSDSHKNKSFQEYAAATAASYAKLLLSYIKDTSEIDGMALRSIKDDQSFFGAFRTALTLFPMHGI